MAGSRPRAGRQAERGDQDHGNDEHRFGRPHDRQRPERMAVADLGEQHAQRAERSPGQQGEADHGRPATAVVDTRNEDDRDDGDRDPDEDEWCRDAFRNDASRDRDGRREHAGHRRDDAHPSHREPVVESGDPDAAGDPGRDTQKEIGAGRDRLGPDDRQAQGDGHPDELRDQHDPEDRATSGQQAATEITRSPGDRRDKTEDDRRRLGREDLVQAFRPDPAAVAARRGAAAAARDPGQSYRVRSGRSARPPGRPRRRTGTTWSGRSPGSRRRSS